MAYMENVSDPSIDLGELLDLKILPAWVHEPAAENRYAHVEDQEQRSRGQRPFRGRRREKEKRRPGGPRERGNREAARPERNRPQRDRTGRRHDQHRQDAHQPARRLPPEVAVRFLPYPHALENVVAQIKTNSLAYSLFALARLFLAKPERYEVRLTSPEQSPLVRLGENGGVASRRDILERSAFHLAQSDFYSVQITETEPIKGNFTNVARCKLSGKVLGPTNHHDYQKRLRNLYEQRFSRRMSFADYQRQIEVVADPQLIEKWKEEARKISTFSTLREETALSFSSATEAEKHFRRTYLPNLIQSVPEVTIDGNASRRSPDHDLRRLIENEWTNETRSPSHMMQELAAQFRQAGLHVFRHRRGMLFVSPVRVRSLPEGAAVSPLITRIMEALAGAPGANRKELADKLIAGLADGEAERAKLALASDLRWLISEGYVIEFNDGTLDLPRGKTKPAKTSVEAAASAADLGAEAAATPAAPVRATAGTVPDAEPFAGLVAPDMSVAEPAVPPGSEASVFAVETPPKPENS
jgi:hypothetical protein